MNVPAAENFRKNLATVIEAKGLSQTLVAEAAKTSQPYVNRVLQGRTTPSLEHAEKLSRAVGFPLASLLGHPKEFSESVLTAISV